MHTHFVPMNITALLLSGARAQPPTTPPLSALIRALPDPSVLLRIPQQCVNIGTSLTTSCSSEISAAQSSGISADNAQQLAQQLTADQIAAEVRSRGITPGCCGVIGTLIDNGCICDAAVREVTSALGVQAAIDGFAAALPDVCGRQGTTCS